MENIYYHPEKSGFEIFDSIEMDASCEYSTTLILRNTESGRLFYVQDSGCSCPTPFDEASEADLKPLVLETIEEFERDIEEHHKYDDVHPSIVLDCLDKVKKYLTQYYIWCFGSRKVH